MAATERTILLKGDLGRRYEESLASGAVLPGHILEYTSDNPTKVKAHSVRGGKIPRAVAIEDGNFGKTVDDAYANGSLTRYLVAATGDWFNLRLKAGENVSDGDWVISYGDGTVCKAATSYLSNDVAASTAVSNTATETTFSNGTATIPKNSLKVGDVIRIEAQGIATATHSTDTLTVKVYIGSTQLATTGALDVANNDIFLVRITLVVRTIGASGTFVATGTASIGASGTATQKIIYVGSTAIDTTVANDITVKATWSVADVGNSVRMDVFTVEQVKAGSSASNGSAGGDVVGIVREPLDLSLESDDDFVTIEMA